MRLVCLYARVKTSGSAMVELAYDIASGATYKFNTAWIGEQVITRIS